MTLRPYVWDFDEEGLRPMTEAEADNRLKYGTFGEPVSVAELVAETQQELQRRRDAGIPRARYPARLTKIPAPLTQD